MARTCNIDQIGKSRAGYPRFWCSEHRASATGKYGVRLSICESAHLSESTDGTFEMDASAYAGGVALWGAVPPVFDTSNRAPDSGIHIHARENVTGRKLIDESRPSVAFNYQADLLTHKRVFVTSPMALSYLASRIAGITPQHLFCVSCGEVHLDSDYFAVHPHRQHLCHACGRMFRANERSVSNPIALIQEKLDLVPPPPIRPGRCLSVNQKDFPGGIQLWASNPALIWTSPKQEEEGIHIHAYLDDVSDPDLNDTYDDVRIDGVHVGESQLRHYMAQQSLAYLRGKVVALVCQNCESPHFDDGYAAFHPHQKHECHDCGTMIHFSGKLRKTVSNPMLNVLQRLKAKVREE